MPSPWVWAADVCDLRRIIPLGHGAMNRSLHGISPAQTLVDADVSRIRSLPSTARVGVDCPTGRKRRTALVGSSGGAERAAFSGEPVLRSHLPEDEDELFLRAGEVNLNVDRAHHSIGQWGTRTCRSPVSSSWPAGVNTPVLEHLHGASVAGLPIMARFKFYAASPYTVWGDRDGIDLSFACEHQGRLYVTGGEDQKEWLASYSTRKAAEHSDSEREHCAPKGAEKLYNALKDKRVTKVRHVDLHEIEDVGD